MCYVIYKSNFGVNLSNQDLLVALLINLCHKLYLNQFTTRQKLKIKILINQIYNYVSVSNCNTYEIKIYDSGCLKFCHLFVRNNS